MAGPLSVENALKVQEKLMDELAEDQITVQQRIDSNHEELSRSITACGSCIGSSLHHFKCEMPTFRSSAIDQPIILLRDLLDYMQFIRVTSQDFKMIIKQSARDWWEYVQQDIDTPAAFRTALTKNRPGTMIGHWGEFRQELLQGYWEDFLSNHLELMDPDNDDPSCDRASNYVLVQGQYVDATGVLYDVQSRL
uniref:Retrotransposon gag domain-containing protein n=1 Tax=Trichogramma kaykai TaxID=54128 RepID=A0ABD2W9A3_9HYME